MKLSLVFELLLIFVLLAFAASKSVKHQKHNTKKLIQNRNDVDKVEDNNINKYCKCVEAYCNCCRDFKLPVVELNGPGCASLMYINGDKMSVSLSFGRKVITNRTLSSRKPSPVCMPLPGGLSKFCGRVYNIARAGEEFRACLGLELQSKSTVEAAVRVSCFKFGPRGVTSEPADPLPLVPQNEKADDDDDDDDDDDYDDDTFGLGSDDDDDDDALDAVNDVGTADYAGFSLIDEDLLGDLFGSSGGKKSNKNKNKKKQAPAPTTTTTKRPRPTRPRPTRRPNTRSTTPRPNRRTTTVRTRPPTGNRRPTRRPTRKPSRRTTTPKTSTAAFTSTSPTTIFTSTDATSIQTTERNVLDTSVEQTFEPIIIQRPTVSLSSTTMKSVSEIEDAGLKMSLAQLTGQLSSLQVAPIIPKGKDSNSVGKFNQPTYEKVLTITPRPPTTVPLLNAVDEMGDDMVEIGQTHEDSTEPEPISADETRAYEYGAPVPDNYFEGISLPRKKNRDPFKLVDLDVLDLTHIGERLGDELGIFGKKRQHRDNKDTKVQGQKDHSYEYDEIIDTLGDSLMMRKSGNKKDRRRQNKMMRGEWSHV